MGSQFEWRVERVDSDEFRSSRTDISDRLDSGEFSSAVTVRAGSDEYTLTTARPTLSESYSSLPPDGSVSDLRSESISSRKYAKSEDSDSSVVDHDIAMPGQPPAFFDGSRRRQPPSKIIITLGVRDVLGYPVLRLSRYVAVMQHKKSVVDHSASSNGVYRNLFYISSWFAFTSPTGFTLTAELVKSVWRRHGIWGFFHGFPAYACHKLLCDLATFIVPRYIAPQLEAGALGAYKSVFTFGHGSLSHLRDRYAGVWRSSSVESGYESDNSQPSTWNMNPITGFLSRNIEFDAYEFSQHALVELLTYPMLTVSSRAMIYDVAAPMNSISLVKDSIAHEGALSLYRGFFWRLLALLLEDMQKHSAGKPRPFDVIADDSRTDLDNIVPVFLTFGSSICHQMSLVERCMSSVDGFCVEASTASTLSKFPWANITVQMALTFCLLNLRDRLVD
ncbi:hypothetical protein, conserved [Babesia bigemina]|uniref:Uncharacterized protein n=1 Tax=Babesia bigemina TaxID=5866 RepID=A0A061D7N1_BABBI|nr:hypothetical protein, conserved [Babesia bigemina]CDR96701.1 hypothetical protein, conserved [Babesia bigemina]|eukprot:XP_012768887.1 hypothetical protein, conserved [Babesia bigemina]